MITISTLSSWACMASGNALNATGELDVVCDRVEEVCTGDAVVEAVLETGEVAAQHLLEVVVQQRGRQAGLPARPSKAPARRRDGAADCPRTPFCATPWYLGIAAGRPRRV